MKEVFANAVLCPHDVPAYQFIEKVGRTAYKSEDKMTDGSAVEFVRNMVKSCHWAVLEHEYLYVVLDRDSVDFIKEISNEKYLNVVDKYISGSFRAWHEVFERAELHSTTCKNVLMSIYEQASEQYPEVFQSDKLDEYYADDCGTGAHIVSREVFAEAMEREYGGGALMRCLPFSILFTCDRGVTHELVRHRPCAFLQESTRYCSYDKGKFGKEITVITPCFLTTKKNPNLDWNTLPESKAAAIKGQLSGEERKSVYNAWKVTQSLSELSYMTMVEHGASAQEARSVLTNSLKADIWVTATGEEWQHILNLRYFGVTGKPHPQMLEVMSIAYPQLHKASNGEIH